MKRDGELERHEFERLANAKEFVATCHTVLIPVNEHVSYFCVEPLDDKERNGKNSDVQHLQEVVADNGGE